MARMILTLPLLVVAMIPLLLKFISHGVSAEPPDVGDSAADIINDIPLHSLPPLSSSVSSLDDFNKRLVLPLSDEYMDGREGCPYLMPPSIPTLRHHS